MSLRRVVPFALLAVAMLVLGWIEVTHQPYWASDAYRRYRITASNEQYQSYVALLLGCAAVFVAGRLPSLSLGLLWALLAFHWVTATPFMLVEVGVLLIGFACAAWGRPATALLSGLSIPAAAMFAVGYIFWFRDNHPGTFLAQLHSWGLSDTALEVLNSGWGPRAVLGMLALLALAVPWLLGLLVRSRVNEAASHARQIEAESDRAVAERQRDQAAELAHLRDAQNQLSRDVHDVVGHSLTVILAQAEAAQFGDDPDQLKRTLATITDTARSSLTDVRQVLAQTLGEPPPLPVEADLQVLLEGVRAGGHPVGLTDVGQPRPLPPDLAPVAHRVLQEMLTNAVRHGVPEGPITVDRHWERGLEITVTNRIAPDAHPPRNGTGITGMKHRLSAVGGWLDVRAEPDHFTVTATLPLPGRQESR